MAIVGSHRWLSKRGIVEEDMVRLVGETVNDAQLKRCSSCCSNWDDELKNTQLCTEPRLSVDDHWVRLLIIGINMSRLHMPS